MLQHKVEKEGVIETRIEKKTTIITGSIDEDEYDHDKVRFDLIMAGL